MFDFAWTEIAVVVVVALVAIGPKDMPVALRAVTNAIKKARRMASEFQSHVDEMVKDADLQEVRDQINQIRNFDVKGAVERAVDPDGSLSSTFTSNPLDPEGWSTADEPEPPSLEPEPEPEVEPLDPELLAIPAFVPPQIARPPSPPAFLPPATLLHPAPRA
jgi:sec-independent protein translocase protein TatB